MKRITAITGMALAIVLSSNANAYDEWVQCTNPDTGIIQIFKGRCPAGWY